MGILRRSSFLRAGLARRAAAVSASGLAFVLLFVAPVRAQEPAQEGRRVAEVRVVDEAGNSVPEKVPPLPLEAGKPFDFAAERESLRALYRMGDYSDIRVTATPQADGLRVNFVVRRNFYNNVIRIEGLKPPPTAPAALAALRLGLGEPFRESAFEDAIERLRETLRDDGLYRAKITWALSPHEDTRQMDVTVKVDPGTRARAGDITVANNTPYPDRQLLRRSKISSKNDLTAAVVSRASQRLRKFLVDQGYLGAGVVITPGTYDPQSNRVPLKFAVTAGPRVRIEISGARLGQSARRKLLPMYAEGAVDEDLLQEGRRNVRDYFQSQGYFDVDVQVSSREPRDGDARGERVISYEIARGDRFRLSGVAFDGNEYFGSGLLSRRLQLQPASFASSGRFSQQMLRADTDSIRAVYLSNGFRDAQVSSTVDDRYQDKKNNLFVSFHIVEGSQTRVADLQIEGNRAIAADALLAVTGSTPGQPFSESGVASDRNNILALYYNEGFPAAAFREEVFAGAKPNEVRLVYHITEGNRTEVAKVLLTGYRYTRPGIIARQVEMQPGEPLRQGDVAKTQRQLYNLGVFNRVQIAPQNPDGTDPEKAVIVEVQEGQRYTIGYGIGFEIQRIAGGSTDPSGTILSASPRGIFEIARANMFGRAQTLTFKTRVSSLDYRVLLGFTADNFLTKRSLSLQLTGFANRTQDVNTFTSTRFEGGLQVVQQLSPASSVLYRSFYRRVKASDLNRTINPEQIPLLSQPTLVSGFGITYARDRRDNPGDATRGTFNTVDVSDAIKAIGSSASFLRGYFQNSSFYSFGKAFVVARSVRFGVEQPFGKTLAPDDPSCLANPATCVTVPLPERFFAGGGTSLRGFGLNQAGPRDPVTGFPVGGLALLVFNQELRFPMRLPFVGSRLGGTLFYDAGNVYNDIYHISFAWKPPSLTNLNYFSHTVGLGLRYPTPIGPVRVDFGYQLNPASYQANDPITSEPKTLRLPHFGFFFNIGPVF
jgi:outer membrane protein assembly complex protein YaeT